MDTQHSSISYNSSLNQFRKLLGSIRFRISQNINVFPTESSTSGSSDDEYTHSQVSEILGIAPENSSNGPFMLYIAVQKRLYDPFEAVLKMNADTNETIQNGKSVTSAYQLCIDLNLPRFLVSLLEFGANPEKQFSMTRLDNNNQNDQRAGFISYKLPALCYCARYNRPECARILLNFGAKLTTSDSENRNAFYFASKYGHSKVLSVLLKAAKPNQITTLVNNQSTPTGQTPLIWATFNAHSSCAVQLLNHGADPNICESDGTSSLIWASHQGDEHLVHLLLKYGANVNHIERNGYSALYSAARKWSTTNIQLLLDFGADSNIESKEGWTPLHAACGERKPQIVSTLISSPLTKFNPKTKEPHGRFQSNNSPLDIAVQSGAFGCVDKILSQLPT